MLSSLKGRIGVIVGLIVLCAWALIPKEGPNGHKISPLNLGLDLQGGMHLAVEISDPDHSLSAKEKADAIDRTLTTIRNRVDEFGVREPTIQKVGSDRIIVELAGIDDPERAKSIVERTAFLEFQIVRSGDELRRLLPRMDSAIVATLGPQKLETFETAGNEQQKGLQEILGGKAGADTAGSDSSGAAARDTGAVAAGAGKSDTTGGANEASMRPLSSLLLESGTKGEFLVAAQDKPTVEKYLSLNAVKRIVPKTIDLEWSADPTGQGGNSYWVLYDLDSNPLLTGDYLADAGPATRDPTFNQPIVPFQMTRQGARIFERGTSKHVGDYMAIVLDHKVQSAPVIKEALSRRAQIEMGSGSSLQEAQDLALVLRAGALPQPIKLVEERTVGPSLGADSIRQGRIAFTVGIVLVVLLMIVYYRLAGTMAVAALLVYCILVLGALAGLGATLTLPGIAGLILSVGMAVDANVLIFERIREETDAGKTPRTAVEAGFSEALSAIVDANLTTLITAIILYQFGTGPIKGFAVTLSIGILASFFSAIYVTRTFFMIYLERHSATEPISI